MLANPDARAQFITIDLHILNMAVRDNPNAEAPRYAVPIKNFVTVEHPFVVKNKSKAIDMIGGPELVSESLQTERPLNLSFNHHDSASRKLPSLHNTTENVLLQITVPKRIGKRKRGSNDAFTPMQALSPVMRDSKYLLRAMADNREHTTVEAVGSLRQSHIWRSMPDFDYSTRTSDFLREIKSKVLPQDYRLLREWDLSKVHAHQRTEVAPPPAFSNQFLPNPYMYQQSEIGDGAVYDDPSQRRDKVFTVSRGALEAYPTIPPADVPPLDEMTPSARKLLPVIRKLFIQRPIWSRRALGNHVPGGNLAVSSVRQGLAHVAFTISSGPWSRTLCAFGVDPRTDPEYRKYQTITTANDQKRDKDDEMENTIPGLVQSSALDNSGRSHVFTGEGPVFDDGATFQLCDLEDLQLKSLVDIADTEISKECDAEVMGWYGNGTLTKIRIILRSKMKGIRNGAPIPDSQFERLLTFPEHYDGFRARADPNYDARLIRMPPEASDREKDMANAYREGCRNGGRSKIRRDLDSESQNGDSEYSEAGEQGSDRRRDHDTGETAELGMA